MTINARNIVTNVIGALVIAAITANVSLLWHFNERLIRIEMKMDTLTNDNHITRR